MNPKDKRYEVVQDPDPAKLATIVEEMMKQGWEPLGGVSCALSESDEFRYKLFAQAMIKR
jgi:hypothetical protein